MQIVCPPETVSELTRLSTYNRLPDGRPHVPDDLLERLKAVTTEQVWGVLREHGYHHQFEGNWFVTHPDNILVGRAVTAQFIPKRPDYDELVQETGVGEGRGARGGQNSWVIDLLRSGDVMVVDMFGKVEGGPFVGDNLTTSLGNHGATAVIEGTIRDYQGIREFDNVNIFCRGVHPSFIWEVTLAGINLPVRIGGVCVLPGDVVLGTPTGVIFIPPHLVQAVVEKGEDIASRDAFSRLRLTEGRYTPGEIDTVWTDDIEADYSAWVNAAK